MPRPHPRSCIISQNGESQTITIVTVITYNADQTPTGDPINFTISGEDLSISSQGFLTDIDFDTATLSGVIYGNIVTHTIDLVVTDTYNSSSEVKSYTVNVLPEPNETPYMSTILPIADQLP